MTEHPFIEVSGIIISEPVTVITDVLLAVLCFFFFWKLWKCEKEVAAWNGFFLFTGMATLLGAYVHGFIGAGPESKIVWPWLTMQSLSCMGIYFAEQAVIRNFTGKEEKWLRKISEIKLLLFVFLVFYLKDFIVVVANTALGLLSVMAYYLYAGVRTRDRSSLLIVSGIALSISTAVVFINKISLNKWVSHNDISHLIMMASLYLIYRGASGLTTKENITAAAE
jgi:hypothetical protein